MRTKLFLLSFILLIINSSCEFTPELENYIERNPPADYIEISIETIDPRDTILVIEPIIFSYRLSSPGRKFHGAIFTLQDKNWVIEGPYGYIMIDPIDLLPGIHTLKLDFQYGSGTGSIADQFDLEGYTGNLEWTLLIEGGPAPQIELEYEINSDGFLEINWEPSTQLNFDYYYLRISDGNLMRFVDQKIYDPNITSYIDSCYYGNSISVYLETVVKGWVPNPDLYPVKISEEVPEIYYEQLENDSIRIYWNNSLNKKRYTARLYQTQKSSIYLSGSTDTSVVIPDLVFAQTVSFELETEPYLQEKCGTAPWLFTPRRSKLICLDDSLPIPGFSMNNMHPGSGSIFDYNRSEDLLFWSFRRNTFLVDSESLTPVRTIPSNSVYNTPPSVHTDINSSRFIIRNADFTHLYNNSSDDNPVELPFKIDQASLYHIIFTENDKLVYLNNLKLNIYDISTGNLRPNILDLGGSIFSASKDGKYLAVVSRNVGKKLYNIENDSIYIINSLGDEQIRSVLFDPINPEQLCVSYNNSPIIQLFKVPEMNVIKTIQFDDPVSINNIDIDTGFMLTTSKNKINNYHQNYVIDLNEDAVIFSTPTYSVDNRLLGGKLFSRKGLYLDLRNILR
jgi:hypothetical protein